MTSSMSMDQTANRSHDICSFIRRSNLFDTWICIVSGERFSLKIEFYHHPISTFYWFSNFVYCLSRV